MAIVLSVKDDGRIILHASGVQDGQTLSDFSRPVAPNEIIDGKRASEYEVGFHTLTKLPES